MANQLKMALIEASLTLFQRGRSQRRIARELDIDREGVGRYPAAGGKINTSQRAPGSAGAEAESKPAIALAGSAAVPDTELLARAGESISPATGAVAALAGGVRRGRPSICEPWRAVIEVKLT
jgi:hypothetical protein